MATFRVQAENGHEYTIEARDDITPAELQEGLQSALGIHPRPTAVPAILRGAGAAASLLGPVAGAVGGGVSELIAGALEGDINPKQVAVQAGLGAIPGLPALRAARPLARVATHAAVGAGMASAGSALTELAATGKVDLRSAWKAALLGGTLGGVVSGRQLQLMRRAAGEDLEGPAAALLAPRTQLRGRPRTQPDAIFTDAVRTQRIRELAGTVGEMGEAGVDLLNQTQAAQRGERLFRQLGELMREGDINPEELVGVLNRAGMTTEEFVRHYRLTISESAQRLNLLSQLKRGLLRMERTNPELASALSQLEDIPVRAIDYFMDAARVVDDVRRASLVAQVATTSRNIFSQFPRYTLEVLDLALEDAMGGGGGVHGGGTASLTAGAYSLFRALRPRDITRLSEILDRFPLEQMKLFRMPAAEVTLTSRYTNAINTLNQFQEHFFRRAFFDLRLRRSLASAGMDVGAALRDPSSIPVEFIRDAVNRALEGTFQAEPRTRFGRGALNMWRSARVFTTLVNPFPRFFVNSYKFLTDFSPAGYVKLLGADPTAFTTPGRALEIMSRAHLGTMMLAAGLAVRNSDFAGPKWYQVQLGERVLDMRPFAPFSTFLFYSELMRQMSERGTVNPADLDISAYDWLQGVASINRISGTGLVLVDLLRPQSTAQRQRLVADIVGQYVGGFSVPLRTIKDVIAGVSPEEAAYRETREPARIAGTSLPAAAPFLANIPGVSQMLPEVYSPVRRGRLEAETPWRRQLAGQSLRTLNPVEETIARLNIPGNRIAPKTGIGELDRLTAQVLAERLEPLGTAFVQNPAFQAARPEIQRLLFLQFVREQRRQVNRLIAQERPDLILQRRWRRMNPEIREILEDAGVPISQVINQ